MSTFQQTHTHAHTGVLRLASKSALLYCAPQSVCDHGHGGLALFPGCMGCIHHQRGSRMLETELAVFVQALAVELTALILMYLAVLKIACL